MGETFPEALSGEGLGGGCLEGGYLGSEYTYLGDELLRGEYFGGEHHQR